MEKVNCIYFLLWAIYTLSPKKVAVICASIQILQITQKGIAIEGKRCYNNDKQGALPRIRKEKKQ